MGFQYEEGRYAAEYVSSEPNGDRGRDNAILTGSTALEAGEVLGHVTTPVVAADASNTGDADLSGVVVTLGTAYVPGVYTLVCTAAASDAGTFSVLTPQGASLPDLTVAVAYSGDHINLTIPDGAADWAVGDVVSITVGAGLYAQHDPASSDGSEVAAAILGVNADPSDGDVAIWITARDTEVKAERLGWKAGVTNAQKAAATAALGSRGIVVREGV